ncbi:MAG: MFS transporter [Amylibacter sp.]|nr:MFS transporter [Amylibacter sp.]
MNLTALKSPSFRLYYIGGLCAVNGLWIMRVLIGWMAWELTASASFVGLVAALSLLPTFLTGPFFGVLIDRTNIKLAAIGTNSSMIVCIATLLAIHVSGQLSPTLLSAIAIAIGMVSSAHHPVRMSLAPRLVERDQVGSVVALAALSFNTARMISPALGGIIIDQLGITWALAASILFYFPSLMIVPFLKPRDTRKTGGKEPFMTALKTGINYLRHRPELRLVLLMTALMALSIRGTTEILPVVADGLFNKGAVGLGQLGSAVGAGAVVSAILKAFGPSRPAKTMGLPTIIITTLGILAVAVFGNSNIWNITLIAAAALGFASTYLGVSLQSAIQADLPDDMRGRVMSIWIVVATGASALGAFTIGTATQTLGLSLSTILMTCVCLVYFAWLVLPLKTG